jgi:hypothetical protein
MKKSVFGILRNREAAEGAVHRLKAAGFPSDEVSLLFSDPEATRHFAKENATKAAEGATTGVTTGFVVGGIFGWLAGIGALAIPGVGPLVAAGPILAALSGAAVGTAIGGIAGALIGMGIPESEARHYEARVKEGHVLISVHTDDVNVVRARELLREANAEDVATSGEAMGTSRVSGPTATPAVPPQTPPSGTRTP